MDGVLGLELEVSVVGAILSFNLVCCRKYMQTHANTFSMGGKRKASDGGAWERRSE